MTRSYLALPLIPLLLAACTPAEQSLAVGTLGGAAVGAALSSDSDRTKGAIAGAVIGGGAAILLGPSSSAGQCRYRDQYGREYIDAC